MKEIIAPDTASRELRLIQCLADVFWVFALIRIGELVWLRLYSWATTWDFLSHFYGAKALIAGQSPYVIDNLEVKLVSLPLFYPGETFFMWPLMGFEQSTVRWISSVITLGATLALFYVVYRKAGLWRLPNLWLPDRANALAALGLGLFLCNVATIFSLRQSQLSSLVYLLLFLAFLVQRNGYRALLLATAAILKYSLVPVYGLILLSRGKYYSCVVALLLFLLAGVSISLFGLDLASLYTQYGMALAQSITDHGENTYAWGQWWDQIHLQFFKAITVNLFGGVFLGGLFLIGLWREHKNPDLDLNFLLFASSVQVCLGYHRMYDFTFPYLLMIVATHCCYLQKRWAHCCVMSAFLLFLALPRWFLDQLASDVGQLIGDNPWIYLSAVVDNELTQMIPLFGIYTFLFALFTAYFYFFCQKTYQFRMNGD